MRVLALLIVPWALSTFACGSIGPVTGNPEPEWQADPLFISLDEFYAAYTMNLDMIIVDARPAVDYAKDHMIGARPVPFTAVPNCDQAMLEQSGMCFNLPRDRWIVAYCACPHCESELLAEGLIERGYTKVKVLDEGYIAWLERDYPVWRASQ